MTALAGMWLPGRPGAAERGCARMLQAQAIYGQETALLADGDVALGRRIFRTLPEDRFDRGPAVCESGLIVAADLRLDNRSELASALGCDPRGLSDAAILCLAFERWGEGALQRLVGDFAIACWDPGARRLLLARDSAGQKPLHFVEGEDWFAFASMPKGLLALPEVPKRANLQALAASMAGMKDPAESFHDGVSSVRPGEIVEIKDGAVRRRLWWQPDLSPLRLGSESAYVEAVLERIDAAVEARLRAAPPVIGSHLSAGLDSSAVATSAARLLAARGERLAAFTAVPRAGYAGAAPGGRFGDEGPLAAATAALYDNVDHVLVRTGEDMMLPRLDRSYNLSDGPAGNVSNLGWVDTVKDEARRRGVQVLLVGELGNVTFSRAGDELFFHLLKRGRLARLAREIRHARAERTRWRTIAGFTLAPLVPPSLWRAIRRLRFVPVDILDFTALRPEAIQRLSQPGRSPRLIGRNPAGERRDWLDQIRAHDPGRSRKATLAGWGIDTRDPTADRRLVELCLRIPLEAFRAGGRSRGLARTMLAGRVPQAVIDGGRRGYQAADWHEALVRARHEVAQEIDRASRSPQAAEILDIDRLRRLLLDMDAQDWASINAVGNYRSALLQGLAAADFIRRLEGRND